MNKPRIVLWCGNAANHRALAHKISSRFEVVGIIIDMKKSAKKPPFLQKLWTVFLERFFFRSITGAWSFIQQKYAQQYREWPASPLIRVATINSDEAFDFTSQAAPDLIIVSGTAIVKSRMLSLTPRIGIINLHTGLSPYIKGGPNCTNWCIATRQYEKIGNTIMWINEGIDSGNIITSECTPLKGCKNLNDIQWQVMEHAHDLYLRAVRYLLSNPAPYQSVPQQALGKGTLYLTRMWNFNARRKLLQYLPEALRKCGNQNDSSIVTVPLK